MPSSVVLLVACPATISGFLIFRKKNTAVANNVAPITQACAALVIDAARDGWPTSRREV